MFLWKLIKRLVIILMVIVFIVSISGIIFLNSVKVETGPEDLPEEVYQSSQNLEARMALVMFDIVSSTQSSQRNESIAEFFNYLIFKTIRDDINETYDPLNSDGSDAIISDSGFFILDFMIASSNEDGEIVILVSIKRDDFPSFATAFYFHFKIDFTPLTTELTMTLKNVYIDQREISRTVYDYFVSLADKESIENAIDKGKLDLDTYTYTIRFSDYIFG